MKIVYGGRDYKQITSQRGAAPLHLIEMQAQSKRPELRALLPDGEPLGLGVLHRWSKEAAAYGSALERWQADVKAGLRGADDEPGPPECATWLTVINLFLTLRAGGWEGSVLDAAAIRDGDVRYVREVLDTAYDGPSGDDEADVAGGGSPDPSLPASPDGPGISDAGDVPAGSSGTERDEVAPLPE